MTPHLILASTSKVRARLLKEAGVSFSIEAPSVDEDSVKDSLEGERASPADIAIALAELKALSRSRDRPDFVIGADQTLSLGTELFNKAETLEDAAEKLRKLRGKSHQLHSAVCLTKEGAVIWHQITTVTLHMRSFSDSFLQTYLDRNGEAALRSVGAYELEGQGSQLFTRIDGDYFSILGLPLLELMDMLRVHNLLET